MSFHAMSFHVSGGIEMQGQKTSSRVIAYAIDDEEGVRGGGGICTGQHRIIEQQVTYGNGSMTRVRKANSEVAQWNPRLLYTAYSLAITVLNAITSRPE